ncbi:MAG: S-adenosylmethionine decarboxylase [Candidatus Wallbacteria bacterium]|nr:S-adenosylmethionine decarboxylase [Candidatus Wallbacteria bacterium]
MIVREWSVDCHGCQGDLDDALSIEAALRRGSEAVGAVVLGASCTRYQPIGTTVFLPLAESHAMVTTWPEHRFALVSILLCNDKMRPQTILEAVLAHLKPERVQVHETEHTAGETAADFPRETAAT